MDNSDQAVWAADRATQKADEAMAKANTVSWLLEPIRQLLSGCSFRQITGIDGRTIFALGTDGGAGQVPSTVPPAPFTLATQSNPSDPGIIQGGVIYDSPLYSTYNFNDGIAITGLLTSETPTSTDAGWFNLVPDGDGNDLVFLEVKFNSDGSRSYVKIQHKGSGLSPFDDTLAAWASSHNAYVAMDSGGTFQEYARVPLAKAAITYATVGSVTTASAKITQFINEPLYLFARAVAGRGAQYPFIA